MGCQLKVAIIATRFDANDDHIFPIAIEVVSSKNCEDYIDFLNI